jgi:hypothetical protein
LWYLNVFRLFAGVGAFGFWNDFFSSFRKLSAPYTTNRLFALWYLNVFRLFAGVGAFGFIWLYGI